MGKKKKKKEKVIYYDDNSTVADMSGTRKQGKQPPPPESNFKAKARTFFHTMKMMLVPMLCTLAAFGLIYLVLLLITGRLW